MDKERFYTVNEVANLLDISTERVRQYIRSGELRAFISSKRKGYRVTSSQLDEFLAKRESGELDKRKNRSGRKLKPITISDDSLIDFSKPEKEEQKILLCFATEPRQNGKRTALIADAVNKCFVYDRSWDMYNHRNESIEVFISSLETVNNLADDFESAGFKEFGRGFFDQD